MISEKFDDLFPHKERQIVVGVSGGPDSLTLLHLLLTNHYRVIAAHFNHELRPGADQEARFVEKTARLWDVPFVMQKGDVKAFSAEGGLSTEEAARILRYRFLFAEAEKRDAGAVAVGHTADDQAETVLMHIIRGTGVRGLTGMSHIDLPHEWSEHIPLVRPLLSVWGDDIEDYCQQHDLHPVQDPSNLELEYLRNRVRHNLIPELETYNPQIKESLWKMAHILEGEYSLIEDRTHRIYQQTLKDDGDGYRVFPRSVLRDLYTADLRRIIRKVLLELEPESDQVEYRQVERAMRFIAQPTKSGKDHIGSGLAVKLQEEQIYFLRLDRDLPLDPYPQLEQGSTLTLDRVGTYSLGRGWAFELSITREIHDVWNKIMQNDDPFQVWLDRDELSLPLTSAPRKKGERFSPLGMEGERIKVSDLMINEKIPADARRDWPVLRWQDKIVWVPGCRMAHFARVTDATSSALHVRLTKTSAAG